MCQFKCEIQYYEEEGHFHIFIQITDIGANLCDQQFQGIYFGRKKHDCDIDAILEKSFQHGIQNIVLTSGNIEDFLFNIELINQYKQYHMHTTLGFHPCQAKQYNTKLNQEILNLYNQNKNSIVFFGEIGLDYDRLYHANKETQQQAFYNQLCLVAENKLNIPLFLHCRSSYQDFINIIQSVEEKYNYKFKGVVHSFTGTLDEVKDIMNKNYYISFNGLIFKDNNWKQIISACNIDKILTESDCPYCQVKRSFLKEMNLKGYQFSNRGRNEPIGALEVEMVLKQLRERINKNFENLCKIYENL